MISLLEKAHEDGFIDFMVKCSDLLLTFKEQEFLLYASPINSRIKHFKVLGSDFTIEFVNGNMILKTLDNLIVTSDISYEKGKKLVEALFSADNNSEKEKIKLARTKKSGQQAIDTVYWYQTFQYRTAAEKDIFRFDYESALDLNLVVMNVRAPILVNDRFAESFEKINIDFVLGRLEKYQPL